MPTISMFYGVIIRMYYDDNNPPHFHAFFGDYKAIFNFDGKILEGTMPSSKKKLIIAWALIHKDELKANWQLAKNSEILYNINPLK